MFVFTILALLLVNQTHAVTVRCDRETTYPIDDLPMVDYDIACNFGVRFQDTFYWFPRSFYTGTLNRSEPLSAKDASIAVNVTQPTQLAAYTTMWSTSRGVYTLYGVSPPKMTLPIDIRPSIHPVITIEMFGQWSTQAGRTEALFSSHLTDTNVTGDGSVNARTVLTARAPSVGNPCHQFLQPVGIPSWTNCRLPSSSPGTHVHVAVVYNEPHKTATIFVNGVFNQVFTNYSTVDGASSVTLGGQIGRSDVDASYFAPAYVRAWGRELNATEIKLVAAFHNQEYNKPVVSGNYQNAYFPSSQYGYTFQPAGDIPNPLIQAFQYNGTQRSLFMTKTSTLDLMTLPGNFTYDLVFRNCRFYNPTWRSLWNISTDDATYCDLSRSYTFRVWQGVTALSVNLTVFRPFFLGSQSFGARIYHLLQFNRPVMQAQGMIVNRTYARGMGSMILDSLPVRETYTAIRAQDNPQDTLTMITADRTTFVWSFVMPVPSNNEIQAARLPLAPLWNISDDNGVWFYETPRFQWFTVYRGVSAMWGVRGTDCVIGGACNVTVALRWSVPVINFNASADIAITANCSVIEIEYDSNGVETEFVVQSPVLTPGNKFNFTIGINPSTQAASRDYNMSTVAESMALGLYHGAFSFSTQVGIPAPPSNASSTGFAGFSSSSRRNDDGRSSSTALLSTSSMVASSGVSSSNAWISSSTAINNTTRPLSSTAAQGNSTTVSSSTAAQSNNTRTSSSTARAISSSSSGTRVISSSSSSIARPSEDIPSGTVKVRFTIELADNTQVTITIITALRNDIATTIAQLYNVTMEAIRPFVRLSIDEDRAAASSLRRRLLAKSVPVSFVLLGNVTAVLGNTSSGTNTSAPAVSAMSVASSVSAAISNGSLVQTESIYAGLTVPVQQPQVQTVLPTFDSSSSGVGPVDGDTSSSSLSSGAVGGIIAGSIVGGAILVALARLALGGFAKSAAVAAAVKPAVQVQVSEK